MRVDTRIRSAALCAPDQVYTLPRKRCQGNARYPRAYVSARYKQDLITRSLPAYSRHSTAAEPHSFSAHRCSHASQKCAKDLISSSALLRPISKCTHDNTCQSSQRSILHTSKNVSQTSSTPLRCRVR
ncbi:hypothetical protein NDU88_006587 [Pleurodeles waltl]|uniref:Uncharacterized protein n=1 Tax=Pleurodeles waltl TaxID=8319 RepID=A0AAV7WEX4_PLEWA|nr:hypothetical protein NDU88_006587 [Pleurodeles waltl]